jgi:hypothetical protein
MPPLFCPRCQRPNPDNALYCHFDGNVLRAGQVAASQTLNQEFVFPSGRRCHTFDDLAQACRDDWAGARELLRQGAFVRYFTSVGRQDLARVAQESMNQANPDIGLSNLVDSMPLSRSQGPRLDLNPRRVMLGAILAGETRQVPLMVSNQGQGMLQGTLSVSEGGEWLRIGGSQNGQCSVQTSREQQVMLQVDTRGLAAGQAYGAKLTVVTNGGVSEVPARLDLMPHAFARPPFQGVRSPRELAERMRSQPKAAVPLLESGEVGRWFETNGWNYPVRGTPVKGVAGVQQFFENMGLSKPPVVQLGQAEVAHSCQFPETVRGQVSLQTPSKKWVYAAVESDAAWLRVLTPGVSGPQQAQIAYEIDTRLVPAGSNPVGSLTVVANGGQKLSLRVRIQVGGTRPSLARRFLQPVITCTLVFLLLRLALVPVMDLYGRGAAANAALAKVTPYLSADDRPSLSLGKWLQLNWVRIYFNPRPDVLDGVIGPAMPGTENRTREFRDTFTAHLLRVVVGTTWWLGAVLGVLVLWRRSSMMDAPWGLIAGAGAGIALSATIGSLVMIGDIVPHLLWQASLQSDGDQLVLLPVWSALAVVWWTILGVLLGVALTFMGPFGRPILAPVQGLISDLLRLVRLRRLGDFFAPI